MKQQGLYQKYTIIKDSTGEEVMRPAFVLLPESDPHARAALRAYAVSVEAENPVLATELRSWMDSIEPLQWGYFQHEVGSGERGVLVSAWDEKNDALADMRSRRAEYVAGGLKVYDDSPDTETFFTSSSPYYIPQTRHYIALVKHQRR